jgi:TPR repeat protein
MYDDGTGVLEDNAEAVRWYRQAAEQGNNDAQFYLGVMYDEGTGVPEDDNEALRWWRQAAAWGHARAQMSIAWGLLEQGQSDDAIAAAREAARMEPKLSVAHELICDILGSLGQIEEAIAACTDALALDLGNPRILNKIAWMLVTADDLRLRDPQKGLLLAQQAVEANSGQDAASLDTLAEAYYVNGRYDDAIEAERKAIELQPQNEALQKQLHKFEQARLAEAKD